MNKSTRRKFTSAFKAKVCLESLKEHQTIEMLSKKHGLHPTQINSWKKEFLTNSSLIFERGSKSNTQNKEEELMQTLYAQIGELKVANDFLKKKLQ